MWTFIPFWHSLIDRSGPSQTVLNPHILSWTLPCFNGPSKAVLDPPRQSWTLPVCPGPSQAVLKPPRPSWTLPDHSIPSQAALRPSWALPDRSRPSQAALRPSWALPDRTGPSQTVLNPPKPSSTSHPGPIQTVLDLPHCYVLSRIHFTAFDFAGWGGFRDAYAYTSNKHDSTRLFPPQDSLTFSSPWSLWLSWPWPATPLCSLSENTEKTLHKIFKKLYIFICNINITAIMLNHIFWQITDW